MSCAEIRETYASVEVQHLEEDVVATTEVELYKQHPVWEVLRLKRDAAKSARYGNADIEVERKKLVGVLDQALKSKNNPQPSIYTYVLDELQAVVNQVPPEESQFYQFVRQNIAGIAANVRQLPGPPPRQIPNKYVEVLNDVIAARTEELAELRAEISSLAEEITQHKTTLEEHAQEVEQQRTQATEAAARITQTTEAADEQLRGEWDNRLESWEQDRRKKDSSLDEKMADQIALLTVAAQVGERLVEHAAGTLTALNWTERATRERRSGTNMRRLAFAFFGAAVLIGGYIVRQAVTDGFKLTLGDGILRTGIVISIAAVGGYLAAESRRHFKEADSAEEVAAALTALEPFYAGSTDKERREARNSIGDTVFVRNVLSRFTSRDAAKHGNVSNQDISQIVEALSKSATVAQKSQGS